jgi:Ca-activated chloride channel homolog
MITFEYIWLLVLLLVPWVMRLVSPHHESRPALQVPFMARLEELSRQKAATGSAVLQATRVQKMLTLAAWVLIVASLARPQWVGEAVMKTIATRDILLAVDLSVSMDKQDFQAPDGSSTDRLTAVKMVVDDFLKRREGDRVGMILFGSAAFVQTPFTEDIDACRVLLNETETGMAGPQTMIGDAIGLSISVFEKSDLEERVLILLTDGNDSGSKVPPGNAARIAADYGITIHTIAVGAPSRHGSDAIDEETLRAIAETTGGEFYRAQSRKELEGIYRRIDDMKARDAEVIAHRPTTELFHWPLGVALLLVMVFHGIMAARPKRKIKKSPEPEAA